MSSPISSPRLSVVVPTCGRPALVQDCIASILASDFPDFEILVVDQAPSQSLGAELATRFHNDPRILYRHLHPPGASRARNLGIRQARGEVIVFIDDDLEVVPGLLSAYLEALTGITPTPGVIGGKVLPRWLSPRPSWYPEEKEYLLGIYDRGDQLIPMPGTDLPITANCAVLREVVDRAAPFDERIGFSYARRTSMVGGEDSLFALRIKHANYPLYYQPRATAFHKIPKGKLTRRHLFRRSFWEGFTLVTVLHLAGEIKRQQCSGVVRWHLKEIAGQVWQLANQDDRNAALSGKTWMRGLSSCVLSAGVIYASLRLWRRGILP